MQLLKPISHHEFKTSLLVHGLHALAFCEHRGSVGGSRVIVPLPDGGDCGFLALDIKLNASSQGEFRVEPCEFEVLAGRGLGTRDWHCFLADLDFDDSHLVIDCGGVRRDVSAWVLDSVQEPLSGNDWNGPGASLPEIVDDHQN